MQESIDILHKKLAEKVKSEAILSEKCRSLQTELEKKDLMKEDTVYERADDESNNTTFDHACRSVHQVCELVSETDFRLLTAELVLEKQGH